MARRTVLALAGMWLLIGTPIVPPEAAGETCRPMVGYFVSTFDLGPGCPDSTTMPPQCTHGKLYSDEARTKQVATYEFSFTSQDFGGMDGERVLVVFEGDSLITENDGTVIYGHDDGDLWLDPGDEGQLSFQTRVYPYGQCPPFGPCYELSTTSSIVADGHLDLLTNTATGVYAGSICTP